METFSIEISAEEIDDSRTKEYFAEVLSSFANGNYRSATVMLWSVTIADLIYKLQSLRDTYSDKNAKTILEEIEKKQEASPTDPSWEIHLVNLVNERRTFFEGIDYHNLTSLQIYRHLSAHPVIKDSTNLLFSPTKEIVRGLIRNTLEGVLLKPPIHSKKISDGFIQDIASVKEKIVDKSDLRKYIRSKYLKNLKLPIRNEIIKTLWKFCFLISNAETDANRRVNVQALWVMYMENPMEFCNLVKSENSKFSIGSNDAMLSFLTRFLSEASSIYSHLSESSLILLRKHIEQNINLTVRSHFMKESFEDHLESLIQHPYEDLSKVSEESFKYLVEYEKSLSEKAYSLGVKIYSESTNYDSADLNFSRFIFPYVKNFNAKTLVELVSLIDKNPQTYDRTKARIDHRLIEERCIELGNVSYSEYLSFCKSLTEVTQRLAETARNQKSLHRTK